MRFHRIVGVLSAVLVLLLGAFLTWVVFTDEEFASVDTFDPIHWEETPDGYTATLQANQDGMVCVCGEYQCSPEFQVSVTKVEPTHLAFEGWLRPSYSIVKDPEARDHPGWGRMVHGNQTCVEREKGQGYTLHLVRSSTNDWLKLSIE